MANELDCLSKLRSLCGGEPSRFAALVGCSLGLSGRGAPRSGTTLLELFPFVTHFLGLEAFKVGAAARLSMGLEESAQGFGRALVARLDRTSRLWGLAGAAFAAGNGTAAEFSTTLRDVAAAFELEEEDIVESAQLLEARGLPFQVIEEPRHEYGDRRHASFRARGRDVAISWRPSAVQRERVTSQYPINHDHLTPGESLPITEPLQQLARRFPWPQHCPGNPFDRRGWFSETHMRAFLQFLPREPALILEIGSFLGASLRFMMELRPGSFFIAVDPFAMPKTEKEGTCLYDFRDNFYANCWNYRDRLVVIPQASQAAFPALRELGVRPDVVYVDGVHTYQAVKEEAQHSLELNPRVLLIGDDYSDPAAIACGVPEAVAEVAAATGRQLQLVDGHVWVLPPRAE